MRLVCKNNLFVKSLKKGLWPMSREEKEEKTLALTVGREYEVQIASRVGKGNVGSFLDTNLFLNTEFFLMVFTDNNLWEAVTLADIFPDESLHSRDELNQLIQTVFENPKT